jgi:hypothetical protein
MQKINLIIVAFMFAQPLFSQEVKNAAKPSSGDKPKEVVFKTIGSINISADAKQSFYLNFGGPNINFNFGKFGFTYGMFPSLRFFHGDVSDTNNSYRTKTIATPILGAGPTIYYNKLAVVLPMYYLPANNVWVISGGLGYKF